MNEKLRAAIDSIFGSSRSVYLTISLYLLVLAVLRGLLFPGISEDDAEQLFFAQSWALGYKGNQPPLFTWLVKTLEQLVGVGIFSVIAIKFGLLLAFYGFSFATARRLIKSPLIVAAAALSPVTLYIIGWDVIVNYSNSILLATAQAATLYVLFRLRDSKAMINFTWLGVALAAGVLAKYNFVLFLVPALAAGTFHPVIRARLFSPGFLITITITLVLVAPHAYWVFNDPEGLSSVIAADRPWKQIDDGLTAAIFGVGNLLKNSVVFLMPMILLIALFMPSAFKPLGDRSSAITGYFAVYFSTLMVLTIALVLLSGATSVNTHWLFGLLPLPLYLFHRYEANVTTAPTNRLVWYLTTLTAIALTIIIALSVRSFSAPDYCKKCNFFLPWNVVSDQLRDAGFSHGTIVTFDYPNQISGNLRRFFPKARVTSDRFRAIVLPPAKAPGACLIAWNPAVEPMGYGRKAAVAYAARMLNAKVPAAAEPDFIEATIAGSKGRIFRLEYFLFKDGLGHCR